MSDDYDPIKTILALDFDGVINSYSSGYTAEDVLPDPPVEGALEALGWRIDP